MSQSPLSDIRREAAIRNLDEQIVKQKEALRLLHSTRNQLVPISRLHPETLLSIFQLFCFGDDKPPEGKCQVKPQLVLTWISRRWRELAGGHSHLWRDLNFISPPGLVETVALRGQQAKLNINISIHSVQLDRLSSVLTFLPTIHCMRVLRVEDPPPRGRRRQLSEDEEISPTLDPCLLEWQNSTPTLTTLTLSRIHLPNAILGGHCPSLTVLELMHCDFSWKNLPTLPNLTSLKVSYPTQHVSVTDFVPGLAMMPYLQTLHLEGIFSEPGTALNPPAVSSEMDGQDESKNAPNDDDDLGDMPPPPSNPNSSKSHQSPIPQSPAIQLPRLKEVHLTERGHACGNISVFLSALKLPNILQLDVSSLGDADSLPIMEAIIQSRSISTYLNVRALGIVIDFEEYTYRFDEDGGKSMSLRFQHKCPSMGVVSKALTPFKFNPSRSTSVELGGYRIYYTPSDSFISFFNMLGSMRMTSLIINEQHTVPFLAFIKHQIEELPKVRGNGSKSWTNLPSHRARSLFSLSHLHIREGFVDGAVKDWRVLLRWLKNYGPKLSSLILDDFGSPPSAGMLREFREVVGKVVLL
ncbi:hypothetical protein BDN72DRAFT_962823, partial [Pluteus cervinus]